MMRNRIVVLAVVVFVLSLWAWWPALSVGFLADDYEWFGHVSDLRVDEVWKLFWYPTLEFVRFSRYRPLVGLAFWFDFRRFQYQEWGYHLTNLLLHGLAVFGVFLVLSSLLRRYKDRVWLALVAAGFFSVNPLLPWAVTWIDGRHDVIASSIILISIWLFIHGYHLRKNKGWCLTVSALTGVVSLLAKETGFILPLIICTIIIYYQVERYNKVSIDLFYFEVKRVQSWFWIFFGGAVVYIIIGSLSLGKFIFVEKGYALGISRPFLLWIMVTLVILCIRLFREFPKLRGAWLTWWWIGFSLLPVAFLPTQLRFLYLPSIFSTIFLTLFVSELTWSRGRMVLVMWGFVLAVFVSAYILRSENLVWLRVSQYSSELNGQIVEKIEFGRPKLVYIFNLPNRISGIPVFLSYAKEAVLLEAERLGKTFPRYPLEIICGPMMADFGETRAEVVDSSRVEVTSESGFVVFEPSVVRRFPDGALEVDWLGEWQATVSADRKEVVVNLPCSLNQDGVLGLTLFDGRIEELFSQ